MNIVQHPLPVDLANGCVLTPGSFDGLHLGHRTLLQRTRSMARSQSLPAIMVTFHPHPREVLTGRHVPVLTTVAERTEQARLLGMDGVSVVQFTTEIAALDPAAFVHRVLVAEFNLKGIVVGHDHRFGQGRSGDEALLRSLGSEFGFLVESVNAVELSGSSVSSSRIRVALGMGDVIEAQRLLGYPYGMEGTVVHGAGRGKSIGFPTANLILEDERKVIPERGVYAVRVRLDDGSSHGGMMNIGTRPTFDGSGLHLEVHILDYDGDLYGREVRVEFVQRIRSERKFEGPDALVAQLYEDRKRCRAALG